LPKWKLINFDDKYFPEIDRPTGAWADSEFIKFYSVISMRVKTSG